VSGGSMDKYKQEMNSRCPVGGLKCPCCNLDPNKARLRREARRVIKQQDKQDLAKEALDTESH
jgi:hypothetical protein